MKSGAQPGNLNATKGKPWIRAITRALAQGDADKLRRIADQLIDQAADGDLQAIALLGDRLDGKAAQSVDVKVPDGVKITMDFGSGD